jgi:hypothetical protein
MLTATQPHFHPHSREGEGKGASAASPPITGQYRVPPLLRLTRVDRRWHTAERKSARHRERILCCPRLSRAHHPRSFGTHPAYGVTFSRGLCVAPNERPSSAGRTSTLHRAPAGPNLRETAPLGHPRVRKLEDSAAHGLRISTSEVSARGLACDLLTVL